MKLPSGTLIALGTETGLRPQYLCDLIATRRRPGRKRALLLEAACKKVGYAVSATTWLYGSSEEIKSALTIRQRSTRRKSSRRQTEERRRSTRRQPEDRRQGIRRKDDRQTDQCLPPV